MWTRQSRPSWLAPSYWPVGEESVRERVEFKTITPCVLQMLHLKLWVKYPTARTARNKAAMVWPYGCVRRAGEMLTAWLFVKSRPLLSVLLKPRETYTVSFSSKPLGGAESVLPRLNSALREPWGQSSETKRVIASVLPSLWCWSTGLQRGDRSRNTFTNENTAEIPLDAVERGPEWQRFAEGSGTLRLTR